MVTGLPKGGQRLCSLQGDHMEQNHHSPRDIGVFLSNLNPVCCTCPQRKYNYHWPIHYKPGAELVLKNILQGHLSLL